MADDPGPHPAPPSDLHFRKLPIQEYRGLLYRTFRLDRDPVYFGRTGRCRFDDPEGLYGVLYVALDQYASFIETFGQATGLRTVSTAELKPYGLATLAIQAESLRLVDLTAIGALPRIGADSRLYSGAHRIGRIWSRVFHEHPYQPDGILYPARHDSRRSAVAIFERSPSGSLQDKRWKRRQV